MTPEKIGPYRLERALGRGGMGVVYAAWDERLGRQVALKQLLPEVAGDAHRRERFRREAQAIARLDHSAIVQIYDLLEAPEGDWIVMQYVNGPNLAQRLRDGPLPPAQVLALARDVAGALGAAHEQGVLHRDLKAENVIVAPGGAKVLDFGLAKVFQPSTPGASATLTQGIAGTYRSMSPEQANGFELDPRSDLFALGVLLYEAATALSPFAADTPVATMTRVCTHQQAPASELEPAVPATLSQLIDALLEKDPVRRPASAAAFLLRLESVAEESALPPAVPTDDSPQTQLGPAPGTDRPWRRSRLAGGLALVIAGALVAAILLPRATPPAREPLYVVVARPELGAGTAAEADGDERLAAAALHAALLRTLTSLEGIVALAADGSEEGTTAQGLAELNAADEVLTSSLDCTERRCQATLRRQRGADGQLINVQSFEAPADDPRLLSTAADTYLKASYAGFTLRPGSHELSVRTEDYARFLRLKRRWDEQQPADLEPLLTELAAIRAGSPSFVDAPLLEARMLDRRFFETRAPADLERAFALIDLARSLDPDHPLPLLVLFNLALDAGRLDIAEAAAAELERLEPGDVGALRRRAEVAKARGEGARALELMREAIARRPAARYLMDLANMQLHLGQAAAARATLEDLLRRFPTHLRGEKLLAQVELQAGSPARAAELYTDLLRRRRGFAELSNLGVARLLLGDWPGAAASLEEAYALAPQSAPAALNLADAMTLAGRSQEAAALYARVLELVAQDPAPGYWQTLSVQAQALAHLDRSPEAAAAIQQATAAAPDNPQLAYEAALVYTLIGEPASALASAKRAIAGGFDRRWFALPFFGPLHATPGWSEGVAPRPAPTG